ncbi:amidohydrolase family protein [Leptolyngbya sp. 7M]|nr:amidohydrolase family protein [Leptolyngbya sp. 7M]
MKLLRSMLSSIFLYFILLNSFFVFASPKKQADILVLGGTIVTMGADRRVIEDGAVAVSGGKIVAVGTRADITKSYSGKQTVNAAGKAVIPGLINTHTHIPMVLFRGIADDLDLQEWLTKYIFPAEAKNVRRASSQAFSARSVHGTTGR